MLMVVWRPTPFPLMSSHLGFMSSHLGFTVLLPYSQQPWNHFRCHSLYMSAHGGLQQAAPARKWRARVPSQAQGYKAHPLSTIPARRHGKGRAGGGHRASKGREPGGSDVQGVIE